MSTKDVTIYISSNSKRSNKLLEQMDEWGIDYVKKNVTENPDFMKELQRKGIYGTPTTFIDGTPILGLQKSKIKQELGIDGNNFTRF